ncbi:MAG: hypothetical protein Q8K78_07090, partial [Planctomycetaceae bacterium]|nr:hypothetical protein [Planctomycetaceae bacterium]
MVRSKPVVPKYCQHRGSGQAVVYIDRKPRYLGVYGSPESRREYANVLDALTAGSYSTITSSVVPTRYTVNELVSGFVSRELPRRSDGEAYAFRAAIKVLRQLYGETFVDEFGPIRFRTIRESMVSGDPYAVDARGKPKPRKRWSRPTVNRQTKRIRQIFRWGVSWEMVPTLIVTALETVPSLVIGETTAPEPKPRLAVPQSDIDAVRTQLLPKYRD